jgi:hypothetical protein
MFLFACGALLAACGSDEPEKITDVREGPATTDFRAATTAERFGFTGGGGHGGHHGMQPQGGGGLEWTTPEGWTDKPASQMRQADFGLKRDPQVECYLSVVQGGIGGNVERWYKQMKATPPSPAAIAALPKSPFLGQAGILVDLEGTFVGMGRTPPKEGYRMLGLVVEQPGRTVTLKMTGPAAVVGEEKGRFLELAKSFREGEAASPEAAHGAPIAWDAPPEWETRQGHPMRLVTFAPKGAEGTECWVTILQGPGGGVDANLQLWREQMSQPRLTEAEIAALETVKVLGRDAKFVSITGSLTDMKGTKTAATGMLGAVCALPQALVTVKMTGPAEVLEQEKDRFLAFCRSLRMP